MIVLGMDSLPVKELLPMLSLGGSGPDRLPIFMVDFGVNILKFRNKGIASAIPHHIPFPMQEFFNMFFHFFDPTDILSIEKNNQTQDLWGAPWQGTNARFRGTILECSKSLR